MEVAVVAEVALGEDEGAGEVAWWVSMKTASVRSPSYVV